MIKKPIKKGSIPRKADVNGKTTPPRGEGVKKVKMIASEGEKTNICPLQQTRLSQISKGCDVDKFFSYDCPRIQSHQSYAISSTSRSKASQSLTEQVFALPMDLFFQYLPEPSLESVIFTKSTLRQELLRLARSFRVATTEDMDKIDSMSLEEHLRLVHDLFPKTDSLSNTLKNSAEVTRHLLFLYEKLDKLIQSHCSRMSKKSDLSLMGLICAYSGGLVHHLDQLGLLFLAFGNGISGEDPEPMPIRGIYQFKHYYRLILTAVRAMEYVERVCLIDCRHHRLEANPCLRYYIDTVILSPQPGYKALNWRYHLPTCFYSISSDVIAYIVFIDPSDPSARLLRKKVFLDLLEDTCYLNRTDGVYNLLMPRFVRDEHFMSLFPSAEIGRNVQSSIISLIAPLILLLYNKAKAIAVEVLKLFDVEELNFFWKRMFLTVKDVSIVLNRFQRWFEAMISYATHCILDIEEDKKRRKGLLRKTADGALIGYGVGSAGPVHLYSKLLRITLVTIRELKVEFPNRSYSDKVIKYEITMEDKVKMSEFENMKAFLMRFS